MSQQPLAGIGVLVTRPEAQSDALKHAIHAAGGQPIPFPVIDIKSRPPADIRRNVSEQPRPDIVIFVSANAVSFGLSSVDVEDAQIAAIGPATSAELEQAGLNVDIRPQGGFTTEHILLSDSLSNVAGKRVMIVRGDSGRELLANTLRERGAIVNYLQAYSRCTHQPAQKALAAIEKMWRDRLVSAVMVMSVASLESMLQILPPYCIRQLHKTRLVAPSARVIQTALERIPGLLTTLSPGPGAGDMTDALIASLRTNSDTKMAKKQSTDADNNIDAVVEETSASDAATDAVFAEDEFAAEPEAGGKTSRSLRRLGFAAILLAPIAVAGFFYLAFNETDDDVVDGSAALYRAEVSESIARNEATILDLQNRIAEYSDRGGVSAAEMAALEQRLESRLQTIDPIPERILRLERSFSALQGISTGAQDTWLLAETEYYMQIANAQLQLAGNPHLAALALKLADERLLQLADPALTNVRGVLARELQSLAVTENPDIEGATLTLGGLADLVDSLPLRPEVQATRQQADAPDPELTGVDRALASLKGAVSDVVSVRRTDEAVRPLIAPEALYFLRANLALQLQAARLSLLRGEQAVFRESLDDASAWLEKYYDSESAPVRSTLATIREIRDTSFVSSVPDISESLRLLRQHSAFEAAITEPATAPQPKPQAELTSAPGPGPEPGPETASEPETEPEPEPETASQPEMEPELAQ